jgi:ParB-like chromosome segregation protein Spo0J
MDIPKSNLPSYKVTSVPLNRIDTADATYHITTRTDVDDLLASIRNVGLLNLPILMANGGSFIVVSGFRRIAACGRLDTSEIRARVLESDLNPLECLRIAIADNAFQRPLDLLETSRALHRLSLHFQSVRRLAESTASLGLPSNPSVIKKIRDLCLLPESLQSAIMDDAISLSMAMELKDLPLACAEAFAQLFVELKLSLNKQREIVTLVKDIARREGISEQTLLEERQLEDVVLNRDRDRGLRTREIRKYLRQRRYPQIIKAETQFENQRKQLNLGNDIKLISPKNFEGTTYAINMTFSSIAQLESLSTRLDQLIKNPVLKHIVEGKDDSLS